MTEPIAKVLFTFSASGDVSADWRVVRAHWTEGVSEPYRALIELASETLGASARELLGRACRFTVSRDGHGRQLLGIVQRVEHRGGLLGHALCAVHVVPALQALAQRTDSYIFQNRTAPEILREVLAEGLAPFGREVRLELRREYPAREYCVQYRESDLDFAHRIMADEGISYAFEHQGDAEVLVLFDHADVHAALATVDGGAVPVMGDEAGTADVEAVRRFELVEQVLPTSVVVDDYDWTRPRAALVRESRAADATGVDREVYEHGGAVTLSGYSGGAHSGDDAAARAQLRREQFDARRQRFRGEGYVTTFVPGARFRLQGHGTDGFDGQYVVSRVEHLCDAPEETVVQTARTRERYRNAFECVREGVVLRPRPVTSRPRIEGVQTAVVTGPAGEEIYTDEHGRVRVQFFWDRAGARDERSTCWVRVAQLWAGAGWGSVFIPRVGMEVVVQFIDGDPDRPLVTGCVYNGELRPPYPLPDQRSRSVLRTSSTPGGGGYNELRFEDAAGGEEVYLRAQRDQRVEVLNDRAVAVTRDASAQTGRDESIYVGRNRSTDIVGNEQRSVEGNLNVSVGGDALDDVTGDRTLITRKSFTAHVDQEMRVTVNDGLRAEVGGSSGTSSAMTPDEVTVRAPKKHLVAVGDGASTQLTPERYEVTVPEGIALVCGDTRIEVGKDKIVLQTKSGGKVEIQGDKVTVKTSGTVNIKGSSVSNNG